MRKAMTPSRATTKSGLLEPGEDTNETTRVRRPIGFHPSEISALVNEEVIARHADEAPFMWWLRDRAVSAPHYSLKDLAALDERVEAHVDGLRVSGDYGWRLCERSLHGEGPGAVFPSGALALESGNMEMLESVLEVASKTQEQQRALISAAAWNVLEPVRPAIQSWLSSSNPAVRRIAISAHAVSRRDPGRSLRRLVLDDDGDVRARALEAVAELGRVDLLPTILEARSDRNAACSFFATWAAVRLGDRSARTIQALQSTAISECPYQQRALDLAIRCLPLRETIDWLRQISKHTQGLRLAIYGIGVAGDPALGGVLIEWMENEAVARVAGEAFSTMSGANLSHLDLNQDPPAYQADFEVLDSDSDLPYPAAEKVARWWGANQDGFEPGQRYLCGYKIEPRSLLKTLRDGKQRQRAAAALELALLRPAEPIFEVRARGDSQQRKLQSWTS